MRGMTKERKQLLWDILASMAEYARLRDFSALMDDASYCRLSHLYALYSARRQWDDAKYQELVELLSSLDGGQKVVGCGPLD